MEEPRAISPEANNSKKKILIFLLHLGRSKAKKRRECQVHMPRPWKMCFSANVVAFDLFNICSLEAAMAVFNKQHSKKKGRGGLVCRKKRSHCKQHMHSAHPCYAIMCTHLHGSLHKRKLTDYPWQKFCHKRKRKNKKNKEIKKMMT